VHCHLGPLGTGSGLDSKVRHTTAALPEADRQRQGGEFFCCPAPAPAPGPCNQPRPRWWKGRGGWVLEEEGRGRRERWWWGCGRRRRSDLLRGRAGEQAW